MRLPSTQKVAFESHIATDSRIKILYGEGKGEIKEPSLEITPRGVSKLI